MKKCNAMVILPYNGLENVFSKALQSFENISLTFYTQNPENLKTSAQQDQMKKNYDLVITHLRYVASEYTAGLPVVCMHLTFSDMFYALKSIEKISGKHALVCHQMAHQEELAEYAKTIAEITRHPLDIYRMDKSQDADELLLELKKANYGVVIGGNATIEKARSLGLNAVQIPYGIESVRNSLENAQAIYDAQRQVLSKYRIYRDLLNQVPDYIALKDASGNILYHNGERNEADFRRLIGLYYEADVDNNLANLELEYKGVVWSVTKKKAQEIGSDYTVLCFHRLRYVDETGGGAITYLSSPPSQIISNIYGSARYPNVGDRLDYYKGLDEPTLISGERGLGKESLAFLLNEGQPMIRIDCNNLTLDSFHIFKEEGFQRISETNVSTILLVNADVIIPELQEELADFLENVSKQRKIRVISTAWDEIYRKVSRGGFSSRLYHLLGKICIDVPPLRQVIEEMDEGILQIISDLNLELGRQIVGISPAALVELKAFEWSANLQQLIDILRRAMLAGNSAYIGVEEIRRVIETEKSIWSSSRGAAAFWKGNLEEIERRIIRGILEEEGMNQAKAAKRLGISRSTLWRKIK